MYTKEQEKQALKEYARLGSVHEVIRRLGYPSKSTLYRWYERKKAGLENKHGYIENDPAPVSMGHCCNVSEHPRHPSAELKYEAIHRCFELGEDVECVSREIGYSRLAPEVSEEWDGGANGKEKEHTKTATASSSPGGTI